MAAAAETLKPAAPLLGAKIERLNPTRMAMPGFGWTTHEASIPSNTPPENILASDFWRFVAPRMKRGDHVRWRNDILTRFGEVVVVAADNATGKLELRELWTREVEPAVLAETERGGFTVKDLGVHDGFGIFRDADGKMLAKNIASFDEAQRRVKVEFRPNMAAMAITDAKAGL